MNASTALVRVPKVDVAPAGLVALRRRMIERALDEAVTAAGQPRVWLEALEPRRMMSAAPASFGDHGVATLKVAGVDVINWPLMVGAGAGKVYVVGTGYRADDQSDSDPKWVIARLNADGTPDATFGTDGSGSELFAADAMAVKAFLGADGKLVVVGQMTGGERYAVGRFNADGSFDPGFNGGAVQEFDNGPSPLAGIGGCGAWPTADGGTVVVWTSDGDVAMERLNAAGEPDTTLGPGGRVLAHVDFYRDSPGGGGGWLDDGDTTLIAASAQPDGGALVFVGIWDGPQNVAPPIERVRLDAAGNVVATAVVQTSINSVGFGPDGNWTGGSDDWVVIAPDGSAYVVASSPPAWNQIEKINPDGSPDAHFGQGGIVTFPGDASLWPPALSPDGKLYVYVDSTAVGGTVRLNPDGSIDPTFNGGAPVDFFTDIEIPPYFLPDGSLIVASSYDDASAFPLMLVGADGTMPGAQGSAAAGQDGGGGGQGPAGTPAAWGIDHGNEPGVAHDGLFDRADGATLFDPQGTAVLN